MEGSAHYEGRAIDIFVRPISPENKKRGWAIAQYLVARPTGSRSRRSSSTTGSGRPAAAPATGWRDYDPPERSGDPAILEHRDHVHVDVFD